MAAGTACHGDFNKHNAVTEWLQDRLSRDLESPQAVTTYSCIRNQNLNTRGF